MQIPEDWSLLRKASLEWLNSVKITILAEDSSKLVTQLSPFSSRKIASWVQTVHRWLVTLAGFASLIGWFMSRKFPQTAHPLKNCPATQKFLCKWKLELTAIKPKANRCGSELQESIAKPNRSLHRLKLVKTCWKLRAHYWKPGSCGNIMRGSKIVKLIHRR